MDMYIIFIAAAVITVVAWIIIRINANKDVKASLELQEKYRDTYMFAGNSLVIRKKHPKLKRLLAVKTYTVTKYSKDPERYIYTSATVGGVTTGGVTKRGGQIEGETIATDRGIVILKEAVKRYPSDKPAMYHREVHEICLCGELLEEAKASVIGKYLEGDRIVLVRKTDISEITAAMYKTGNVLAAASSLELDKGKGYALYSECSQIVFWLKSKMK